jgi:hypothetical protein
LMLLCQDRHMHEYVANTTVLVILLLETNHITRFRGHWIRRQQVNDYCMQDVAW